MECSARPSAAMYSTSKPKLARRSAVEDVERLDENADRLIAQPDPLLRAQIDVGVGPDAERVARLAQIALVDQAIAVAIDDPAWVEGGAAAPEDDRPDVDVERHDHR